MKYRNSRSQNRYSLRIKVQVEVRPAPGSGNIEGKLITSKTKDISLGGLCLYSEQQLPVNAELLIAIALGRPEKIFHHAGHVMWSTKKEKDLNYIAGIQLEIDPNVEVSWKKTVLDVLGG